MDKQTPLSEPLGRSHTLPASKDDLTVRITIEGPEGYHDTETFAVSDAKSARTAARKVMKAATSTFERSEASE